MSGPPPSHARHVPASQSGERLLIATSTSGLCNRLLTLAGAMRVAEAARRRLVLYWPVDGNLGCRFEDLFENPIEQLEERHVYDLLHTSNAVTVYQTDTRGQVNRAHYRKVRRDDPAPVIVVKGWGAPGMRWELRTQPRALARTQLRSLVPIEPLRAAIAAPPALEEAIGVHVRRGDHPEAFAGSRDEDFLTILSHVVARRPEVRFHLATDDAATEERFRAAFPGRMLTQPKSAYGLGARGSVTGMREAVIDLYRLARTRAILGNAQSSYSSVASLLGSDRLVVARSRTVGTARGGPWEALLA